MSFFSPCTELYCFAVLSMTCSPRRFPVSPGSTICPMHTSSQLLVFKSDRFASCRFLLFLLFRFAPFFFVLFRFFFFFFRAVSCRFALFVQNPSFSVQYHLHTFPQLLIFKNGHLLSRYRGGPSPESLAAWFSLETGARCVPPGLSPFLLQRKTCIRSCPTSTPPPSICF